MRRSVCTEVPPACRLHTILRRAASISTIFIYLFLTTNQRMSIKNSMKLLSSRLMSGLQNSDFVEEKQKELIVQWVADGWLVFTTNGLFSLMPGFRKFLISVIASKAGNIRGWRRWWESTKKNITFAHSHGLETSFWKRSTLCWPRLTICLVFTSYLSR